MRRTPGRLTGTLRVLNYRGRPSSVPVDLPSVRTGSYGVGCRRFSAPGEASALVFRVRERGRSYPGNLPMRWRGADNRLARQLLLRAQSAMRRLRSVRETEVVTSGPGSFAATEYRVAAPNRLALRTNGRVETVIVGRRKWFRARDSAWQAGDYGAGAAFTTRSWFRWSSYGPRCGCSGSAAKGLGGSPSSR